MEANPPIGVTVCILMFAFIIFRRGIGNYIRHRLSKLISATRRSALWLSDMEADAPSCGFIQPASAGMNTAMISEICPSDSQAEVWVKPGSRRCGDLNGTGRQSGC